ncbi:MAG: hypothetical protein ACOVMQ_08735 [Cyclobacteriaceae bacterium]
MINKGIHILVIGLALAHSSFAQSTNDSTGNRPRYLIDETRYFSLLLGFNFWKENYGELGIAYNQYGTLGHHPMAKAVFFSNEFKIDATKTVIGPKIGVWAAGGSGIIAMGLNLIYYTNFDEATLRFRPEIGMGVNGCKIVYGYNIVVNNKSSILINDHNLGIVVLFKLKKLKTVQH